MGKDPDEVSSEGAADGCRGAGSIEVADGLAFVDERAGVDVVERPEHSDRGCDDHPLRNEETLSVGQEAFHGFIRPPGFRIVG
jgi:hypothetical protein